MRVDVNGNGEATALSVARRKLQTTVAALLARWAPQKTAAVVPGAGRHANAIASENQSEHKVCQHQLLLEDY